MFLSFYCPHGGSPLAFILCQGTCIGHVRWPCGKCSFPDPRWGLKNSLLCAHASLPQYANIPAHLPVSGANFCAPIGGSKTHFCVHMLTCPNVPVSLPTCMYPDANFCAPTGGQQYTRVKMISSPISCLSCSKAYPQLTSQRYTKRCPLRGFQNPLLNFNIGTMGTFVILIILSNLYK